MSPTRVAVDDDEQQIADLLKQVRTLRSRLATTSVKGSHDEFTAAATPATTYTLTYIPLSGTCLMALNGHVQREGTDYTCDYTTGIVTVTATQAASDKITFRYLVTDWLIARSLPADVGSFSDNFNRADSSTTLGVTSTGAVPWQALQGIWGIGTNRAHVVTGDATSPTEQVAVVETGSPDGAVQVTIAAVDGSGISPFVIFRAADRLNYLYWVVNTGAVRQMVAGSSSLIGTAAGVTAGDVVKVVMGGTSVECFRNGTSVGLFTTSTHSTNTKHGLGSDSTVTGNYFDDFSWVGA